MSSSKLMMQAAAGVGGEPEGAWDLSYAYYDPPADVVFDLSTAAYSGVSFSVAAQEAAPYAVFFKPDGTKMYTLGLDGDDVNEYTLSTPWLVSSATFAQVFSVSAQESQPSGLFFKPDGTKMYLCGYDGDDVNEYDLSTAWDVSSASFLQNFSVSAQATFPGGLFFKPDGTKMYVADLDSDDISEYDLSTAWDVSSASYLQNFDASTQDTSPTGLSFKEDGTKMFIAGRGTDTVYEYDLSPAWDVSSASNVGSFSVTSQETSPRGLYFKQDGDAFYVLGDSSDTVFQYSLGGFSVAAQEVGPRALFFREDGLKMYVSGFSGDDVNEYDLSTEWDTSTASYNQNFSVSSQESIPTGLFFKPDGTKMYVIGYTDDVNEYTLSTAWDVSSASYSQDFSVSAQESSPEGLFFKPDGTKMYVVGYSANDNVYEYDLSTAWDISSASYVQNFDVSAQETNPQEVRFKIDGTKMYVCGTTGDDVNEYDLSTAWDISTASYVQNFSIKGQNLIARSFFFRPDGTQMFTIDQSADAVFTYSLGVQE